MAVLTHILTVLLACSTLSQAHNILLRAHSRECFHETLHKEDKMTVTFQVGDREFSGSGNLDVDFWVCKHRPNGTRDTVRRRAQNRSEVIIIASRAPSANTMRARHRFNSPQAHTRSARTPSAPATTPSRRRRMADTRTASATSTGRRTAKRSASTCTAWSTCRSTSCHRIR